MSMFRKAARTVTLTKDVSGAPAIDRTEVEARGGVDMVKKFDKAGVSLSKRGLSGIRAEVVMLLDHSLSMHRDYENGTVQTLVERALGFALQVDGDGVVPVVRFDSRVWPQVDVTLANYADIASSHLYHRNNMGSTNLAGALGEALEAAKTTERPLFVIVITDGQPDNADAATKKVVELAKYPVFLKFLAIQRVGYLETLDDMGGRLVDNADAKFIDDPAGMTDLAFAEAMTDEWDTWITAATTAGLLR
ncbi:hypothetical protein SEA_TROGGLEHUMPER_88 [Rhodococcus phage Trogglehumper]|uniref:VWFA domain-containing protein n=1 Tax=Rhodococcus phage Trogglehumper TaxID=3038381 RepID=A0AAF0K2V1_9CAUD|nr:hypothetical protein SEA_TROGGLEHUMPER_88 [Rhodococcus phage Trogglehumper]